MRSGPPADPNGHDAAALLADGRQPDQRRFRQVPQRWPRAVRADPRRARHRRRADDRRAVPERAADARGTVDAVVARVRGRQGVVGGRRSRRLPDQRCRRRAPLGARQRRSQLPPFFYSDSQHTGSTPIRCQRHAGRRRCPHRRDAAERAAAGLGARVLGLRLGRQLHPAGERDGRRAEGCQPHDFVQSEDPAGVPHGAQGALLRDQPEERARPTRRVLVR
mmetsp:Transcript_52445/g.161456  ORF Transcript_52445/g.161456 Transcript_52445/m.161456 type:complete len:221 (+) Transcript_52445:411-1073(+)